MGILNGCCGDVAIQWVPSPDSSGDYKLVCSNCGCMWSGGNRIPDSQTFAEECPDPNIHLATTVNGSQYQDAWCRLLMEIASKTSWGRNALRDMMLECLVNPVPGRELSPGDGE